MITKDSSELLRFVTQSVSKPAGIAQDNHFPLIWNNALIIGSEFHEFNLHLQLFRERLSCKRREAYARMSKVIMGNGDFTVP